MLQNPKKQSTLSPCSLLSSRATLNFISYQDSSPANFPTPSTTVLGLTCTLLGCSIFEEIKWGDGDWDSPFVLGLQSHSEKMSVVFIELSIIWGTACFHSTFAIHLLYASLHNYCVPTVFWAWWQALKYSLCISGRHSSHEIMKLSFSQNKNVPSQAFRFAYSRWWGVLRAQ